MNRTDLEILTRAEDMLARGFRLSEIDRGAVLKTRLRLIEQGKNMKQVARMFPWLDAVMTCDDAGNPIWIDQ